MESSTKRTEEKPVEDEEDTPEEKRAKRLSAGGQLNKKDTTTRTLWVTGSFNRRQKLARNVNKAEKNKEVKKQKNSQHTVRREPTISSGSRSGAITTELHGHSAPWTRAVGQLNEGHYDTTKPCG